MYCSDQEIEILKKYGCSFSFRKVFLSRQTGSFSTRREHMGMRPFSDFGSSAISFFLDPIRYSWMFQELPVPWTMSEDTVDMRL
jgi:hypothetical protein